MKWQDRRLLVSEGFSSMNEFRASFEWIISMELERLFTVFEFEKRAIGMGRMIAWHGDIRGQVKD